MALETRKFNYVTTDDKMVKVSSLDIAKLKAAHPSKWAGLSSKQINEVLKPGPKGPDLVDLILEGAE